ncbi:MAG TPA: hypothetical protein VLE95_04240 [Chlamydiales bacterium]|nr:hypothetical protein [Chlamydiales bacterium]
MASTVQFHTNHRFRGFSYEPEVQSFGRKKVTLVENHDWKIELSGKSRAYHSLGEAALRYLRSAEGLFRVGQLSERVPKFVNLARQEMGLPRLKPLDVCAQQSRMAWNWLATIPRTIEMTPGVISAVQDAQAALQSNTLLPQQIQFKVETAFREVSDAIAMYAYSMSNVASLFLNTDKLCATCINVGSVSTFSNDLVSLKINAENYARASSIDLTGATHAIKDTVNQTKYYNLLSMAKDIVSCVSGFFGILLLATGVAVVPGIALAALSLASTVFGVSRKLYSETMPFKPLEFLANKNVTYLAV